MTCFQYKRRHPRARPEDAKLQNLARQRLRRQCVICKHMIELAEGCYHMTCVCGYEFYYTCRKEWKEKKTTCTCPLWEERNIIRHDGNGGVYNLDEEEDDYSDEDDDDDAPRLRNKKISIIGFTGVTTITRATTIATTTRQSHIAETICSLFQLYLVHYCY